MRSHEQADGLRADGMLHSATRFAVWGLFVAAGASAACTGTPTIDTADDGIVALLSDYESLSLQHRLRLAPDSEPGERLFVLGRLIRSETGEPIAHHPITLYQADASGSYDESVPGRESTARLNGVVQSDSLGRFLVSTVLPGDYGSTDNNRHIHTSVAGAHPDAYDFLFRQYMNFGLRRWANRSHQGIVLDLRQHGETLLATADLAVVRYDTANAVR